MIGIEQHLVGNDIEFFLRLTLNVVGAGTTKHPAQRPLGYGVADHFAGARNHLDKQSLVGRHCAFFALLFDKVLRQRDAAHWRTTVHAKAANDRRWISSTAPVPAILRYLGARGSPAAAQRE